MKLFQWSLVAGVIGLMFAGVASASLYGTSIDPVGTKLTIEERPMSGDVVSAELGRERPDRKTGKPTRVVIFTRKFYRDADGNKVETTLGDARRMYDANGRIVRIEDSYVDGATRETKNSVLAIEYNEQGAITRLQETVNGQVKNDLAAKVAALPNGGYSCAMEIDAFVGGKAPTTYVFNAKGLLMERHQQMPKRPMQVMKLTRNEQGDVTAWQWPGSKTQWKYEYEYDDKNNWTKRITSSKDDAADWVVKETETRTIAYLKAGEKLAAAPAPRGGPGPALKQPAFQTKPEDLYAGPPIDQKKLAGKYHYSLGKVGDPVHSTTDLELRADSTMSWTAVNHVGAKAHTLRATGGWMWQNNTVHVVLSKVQEGPPMPAEPPTFQFQLAADGKTLLAPGPGKSRFERRD